MILSFVRLHHHLLQNDRCFLHAWQTINKYYKYFLTYMKNQAAVEPDQFCWGARTFLTALKVNPPSSCSGGPVMSQRHIQTCFDTV